MSMTMSLHPVTNKELPLKNQRQICTLTSQQIYCQTKLTDPGIIQKYYDNTNWYAIKTCVADAL